MHDNHILHSGMAAFDAQLDGVKMLDWILSRIASKPNTMAADLAPQWRIDREIMQQAVPFMWTPGTVDAVMKAALDIPGDTLINTWNLDTDAVWWYFDTPLPLQTISDETAPIVALSGGWVYGARHRVSGAVVDKVFVLSAWVPYEKGSIRNIPSQVWTWYPDESLDDMLARVQLEHRALYGPTGPWRHRKAIGEHLFCKAAEVMSRFVLAGFAWINQKVLVLGDGHIQRQRRKEFAKLTRNHEVSSVRIIQLRKAEHVKTLDDNPPIERTEAYYSCRFEVEGHWRNQACGPKFSDRRLMWIEKFEKGPEDAPRKTPRPKVYVVTR